MPIYTLDMTMFRDEVWDYVQTWNFMDRDGWTPSTTPRTYTRFFDTEALAHEYRLTLQTALQEQFDVHAWFLWHKHG